MTKNSVLVVVLVVLVVVLVVAIGAQLWNGDPDPGVHQTDRDTVMDRAPLEPPTPPQPPAGRSGGGP